MNKEDKEQLIRQFLDGELDADREKAALRLMAEEEEYRELLHFEIYLNSAFSRQTTEEESFAVPKGFADQVMQAVEQKETEQSTAESEKRQNVTDWIREKIGSIMEPRTVRWRPAYGLAAVLAVIALVLSLDLGPRVSPTQQQATRADLEQQSQDRQPVKVASVSTSEADQVWARFFYVNDGANSVAVAGDFSNWEPIPLDKKQVNGQTVWTNTIEMQRGEHRYMYIINGNEWKTDPLANRYKQDGFGNRNAVISL